MFEYTPGANIVEDGSDLIVNTVNTVGVMGKGVALAFRERFPEILQPYRDACADGRLQPGGFQLLPLKNGKTVVNLATKQHWRDPSRSEWVGCGLLLVARWFQLHPERATFIALPPPGCGNGGLDWARVHRMALQVLLPAARNGLRIRFTAECPPEVDTPVFVAGIGSRQTPGPVLGLMRDIAERFAENGWRLRSGNALGADRAFAEGALRGGDPGEIWLPEPRSGVPGGICDIRPVHRKVALAFHDHPQALRAASPIVQSLMARNTSQLFGADFDVASKLVIAWTKDGGLHGGTAQALRMAECAGIPVLNLGRPDLRGIGPEEAVAMGRDLIAAREAELRAPFLRSSTPAPAP